MTPGSRISFLSLIVIVNMNVYILLYNLLSKNLTFYELLFILINMYLYHIIFDGCIIFNILIEFAM